VSAIAAATRPTVDPSPRPEAARARLLATAGEFKGEPWLAWLPVDLTLLAALATVAVVLVEAYRQAFTIPRALFLLLPLFVAFLPSLWWTEWIPYATDKARYFFTLTLLATIAPAFLLTTPERIQRFLHTVTLVALFISVNAFYFFFADPTRYERLGVETPVSTIAIGRMAGFALIWITTLMVSGRLNSLLSLAILGFLASVLIGVGSRGPLLLCVVPLFFVFLLFSRGFSSLVRLAEAIQDNPLGIGLGGFTAQLVPWRQFPGQFARDFPHNIVLEAFLEGGWLAGLIFVTLLTIALGKSLGLAVRTPFRVEFTGLFALLTFIVLNDLVSGELNDSRLLFAFLGATIGLPSVARLAQERR
jgi:hypothetical protein